MTIYYMSKNIFLKPAIELIQKIIRLDSGEFIDWYVSIIGVKGGITSLEKFLIYHCHKLEDQVENLDSITNMLKFFKYKHIQPKYLLMLQNRTIIDIKRMVVYELTSKYL
jgi:hypothetical protein